MSLESEDILYLMWKGSTQEKYKVGKLWRRENKYYFKYMVEEVKKAMEVGFELLEGFPRIDAEYFKEELFTAFSKNITTKSKRDVMEKEETTDEFKILKSISIDDDKEGFCFES